MTPDQLTAFIRDHATKTADGISNGWDHISEFLSDQDIATEIHEYSITSEAEALAHFQAIADYWHDYNS